MFTLKQSLGVIGGKPNHAHYFIGFNGKNYFCSLYNVYCIGLELSSVMARIRMCIRVCIQWRIQSLFGRTGSPAARFFFQVALRGVSRLAKTAFANICFFGAVACVLRIFPEDQKYFQCKCLK